jgi:hypothetical protein
MMYLDSLVYRLLLCMAIASVLLCGSIAHAITCDECMKKTKEMGEIQGKIDKLEEEMKEAYDAKRFRKARNINKDIIALRKKRYDLSKDKEGCAEACSPDTLKEQECKELKKKILEKESGNSLSKADIREVDELYKELRTCNKLLKRIKKRR